MWIKLCIFASIILSVLAVIKTDCAFPKKNELTDDLFDDDFKKVCSSFNGDIAGIMNNANSLLPNVMKLNVENVLDSLKSLIEDLWDLKGTPVSCAEEIMKNLCGSKPFQTLRAVLSTFGFGASAGVSFTVEGNVSISLNPAEIFDMICFPQTNTKEIYNRLNKTDETFLCGLNKQTEMITEIMDQNLETILEGQIGVNEDVKKQLKTVQKYLKNVMDAKFGQAEAMAQTFHNETITNLRLISKYIGKSYSSLKLDDIFISDHFLSKLEKLRREYRDNIKEENVNNGTLSKRCKDYDPVEILEEMGILVAHERLNPIIEIDNYAQKGFINLALAYKYAIQLLKFYISFCHPFGIYGIPADKGRRLIDSRQKDIAIEIQKLYDHWDKNHFNRNNIEEIILAQFNNSKDDNKQLALNIYSSIINKFGVAKHFYHVGVRNTEKTLKNETIEGMHDGDSHFFTFVSKSVFVIRVLKSQKYVDCYYFDQKNSKILYFSKEEDAMEFHRKICPGTQVFVPDGFGYEGFHGPGFSSFVLAYKNNLNAKSYVNVVHPLKICDKYCVL